jgi:hypothetical protein
LQPIKEDRWYLHSRKKKSALERTSFGTQKEVWMGATMNIGGRCAQVEREIEAETVAERVKAGEWRKIRGFLNWLLVKEQ